MRTVGIIGVFVVLCAGVIFGVAWDAHKKATEEYNRQLAQMESDCRTLRPDQNGNFIGLDKAMEELANAGGGCIYLPPNMRYFRIEDNTFQIGDLPQEQSK